MGRRKIEIQPIIQERNRSVTFQKRKHGLFKKAYELGILCSVDIAVIIVEQRPGHSQKLYEYASSDMQGIVDRHMQHVGDKDTRGPSDYVTTAPNEDVDDVEEDYVGGSPLLLESPGMKRGGEEGHRYDERYSNSYSVPRAANTQQGQHLTKKPRLSPATFSQPSWLAQRGASISQHPNSHKNYVERLACSSSHVHHTLHHPVQFNHLSPPSRIPPVTFFGPPSSSALTITPPALPDTRTESNSLETSKISQDAYAFPGQGPCNISPDLLTAFFHALEGDEYPDSSHVGGQVPTHGSSAPGLASGLNTQSENDLEWPVHNARRYTSASRTDVSALTVDVNTEWLDYLSGTSTSTSIENVHPHPTAVNRWPTPSTPTSLVSSPPHSGFDSDSGIRGEHLVGGGGGGKDIWMTDVADSNRPVHRQELGRRRAGVKRGYVHVKEENANL